MTAKMTRGCLTDNNGVNHYPVLVYDTWTPKPLISEITEEEPVELVVIAVCEAIDCGLGIMVSETFWEEVAKIDAILKAGIEPPALTCSRCCAYSDDREERLVRPVPDMKAAARLLKKLKRSLR